MSTDSVNGARSEAPDAATRGPSGALHASLPFCVQGEGEGECRHSDASLQLEAAPFVSLLQPASLSPQSSSVEAEVHLGTDRRILWRVHTPRVVSE